MHTRRCALLAVCCVLVGLTVPTTAAGRPPRALAFEPLLRSIARDGQLPLVTRQAARRSLVAEANDSGNDRLADASVVDDLDGDRTQDVLTWAMDQTQTSSGAWHDDTTVGVLSGVGGRALWSVEIAGTDSFVVPIPAPVGPRATPGLLLLILRGDTGTVEVRALTGTGHVLWRETPAPPGPGVPAAVAVRGVLTGRSGPVQLLLSWLVGADSGLGVDRVSADLGGGALQLGVLDGATGAVTVLGSPVPAVVATPQAFAGPDLDGDGRDDALVATAVPKDGLLQAVSTRTGAVLWRTSGVDLGEYAFIDAAAQDAVGDKRPDVLLRSAVWSPSMLPTDAPAQQTCTVLDGGTGAASQSVHVPSYGDCWLNGDSDGDERAELLVWDVGAAGHAALNLRAWSPARDRVVWSRHVTLAGSVQQPEDVEVWVSAYGDVQPDGSQELGYELGNDRSGAAAAGVLDGRTGRPAFGRDMRPFGSVDGRSAALLRVVSDLGIVWHLTTVEGRTARVGATYRVQTRDGAYLLDATLLRGPSRCNRNMLLVGSSLSQSGPVAEVAELVDMGSGRVRWARDLAGSRVAPYPVSRSGRELAC